jgi:hypothetical protein
MKQKDLPILVVIIVVSAIFSVFITKFLILPKSNKPLNAEKVDSISADFQKLDSTIFNEQAVNPTKKITIGDSQNTKTGF